MKSKAHAQICIARSILTNCIQGRRNFLTRSTRQLISSLQMCFNAIRCENYPLINHKLTRKGFGQSFLNRYLNWRISFKRIPTVSTFCKKVECSFIQASRVFLITVSCSEKSRRFFKWSILVIDSRRSEIIKYTWYNQTYLVFSVRCII